MSSIGNKEITLDNDFRFVRNYNLASIKKKATNITEPIKIHTTITKLIKETSTFLFTLLGLLIFLYSSIL